MDFFKIFMALIVISSKLPIGVETIYSPDLISCALNSFLNKDDVLN